MDDVTTEMEHKVKPRSRESLFLAYRWCCYAWICALVWILLRHFFSGPMISPVVYAFIFAFFVAGLLFAFVALGLSMLGFVLPGGVARGAFWGPVIATLPPLVFPVVDLIGKFGTR